MPTRPMRKPKKKYPYRIRPVDLPDIKTVKRIQPPRMWEFLRVEALYRSEKVQELYMQGKQKGAPLLLQRFNFPWMFFTSNLAIWPKGTEVPGPKGIMSDFVETGILDLAKLKKERPDLYDRWLNEAAFPNLTLAFNSLVPTETIIKNLRPLLQQRHTSLPSGKRPFRIIDPTVPKTYLNYLHSYDLYQCQQFTPREIGLRMYPTHKKPTMMARTALKRAKKIIQQAEKGEWPPKI